MHTLNDIALQIHMTFLNHKDSVEWISSFKDEIASLSDYDFQTLINMLEGISQAEHNNFAEALTMNNIPAHLQKRATTASNFNHLIEHLKLEYFHWQNEK